MKRIWVLSMAALGCYGVSAHAGCADPRLVARNAAGRMPMVVLPTPSADTPSPQPEHFDRDGPPIVGTWMVSYTSGGAPGGDAFIQWHNDGTEWENIDFPILGGNLCMGSWRPLDGHRVYRSHIGWLYTEGNLSGYFTETETDTVAHNGGSYSGVNDMKIYDLDGNLQVEVPGTAQAVRLSP